MHGTLLHRSQWLAVTCPSVLNGTAALCNTLRVLIEREEAEAALAGGRQQGAGEGALTRTQRLLRDTQIQAVLLSLLLLRPSSGRTARVHATPPPAHERSTLMEAEIRAKEAAGGLLHALLRPSVLGVDGTCAQALLEQDKSDGLQRMRESFRRVMQAVLLLTQPMYPPRLHYIGALLLARLVALLPSSELRTCETFGSGEGGYGMDEAGTGGGVGGLEDTVPIRGNGGNEENEDVQVALFRRLLAIYENVFTSGTSAFVDPKIGNECGWMEDECGCMMRACVFHPLTGVCVADGQGLCGTGRRWSELSALSSRVALQQRSTPSLWASST
jgi:hypothetical protein